MLIENSKTGDMMPFDIDNLPLMKDIQQINDLLLEDQIKSEDVYSLINMYSKKTSFEYKKSGGRIYNTYFTERKELLDMIERVDLFTDHAIQTNKIYRLALYIQHVIDLRTVKTPELLKKLYYHCLDNSFSEDCVSSFAFYLQSFTENVVNIFNDIDEIHYYNKKINQLFASTDSNPQYKYLKGIFLLYEGNIDKAVSIFSSENVQNLSSNKTNKKDKILEVGIELCKAYKKENVNKEKNEMIYLISQLRQLYENTNPIKIASNEESKVILKKIMEMKNKYRKVSILSEDIEYLSPQNFPEILKVISEYLFKITKNKSSYNYNIYRNVCRSIQNFVDKISNAIITNSEKTFLDSMNYYLGKLSHLICDYSAARKFYLNSDLNESKINLMKIDIFSKHEFERKKICDSIDIINLENYNNLINDNPEKIILKYGINDFDIYKTKKEESWSGNAIINYFNLIGNKNIDEKLVYNNLAFFYYKAIKEKEFEMIEKLFEKIKSKFSDIEKFEFPFAKENIINDDETNLKIDIKKPLNNKIYRIGAFIAYNLDKFTDDRTSIYNLSFYAKKEKALQILESINEKCVYITLRKGILKNCLETFKEFINIDDVVSFVFTGMYHHTKGNTNLAKENFKKVIEIYERTSNNNDERMSYFLYSCLILGSIHLSKFRANKNRESLDASLKYFERGLKYNPKCLYCAAFISVIYYEKRDWKNAVIIAREILFDIAKKNTFKELKFFLNKILGASFLKMNMKNEAYKHFYLCGDPQIIKKVNENMHGFEKNENYNLKRKNSIVAENLTKKTRRN